MVYHNAGPDDSISIGWAKLVALDPVPVRYGFAWQLGANQSATKHGPIASCVDFLASLRPRRADTDPCEDANAFASISSIFSRGSRGKREKTNGNSLATGMQIVAYTPARGTYAYDVLQRRFKELDKDGAGYISEGDLKVALKKLYLPASEEDIQSFLNELAETTRTNRITFEKFAEYAINRENKLLETFKELDKRKTGYITANDLKSAARKYKFRVADQKMVGKSLIRGGMPGLPDLYRRSQLFDFAEFRDFLMISSAKDLRDAFEIWGRAVVDLGDLDISFPLSSGRYDKRRRLGQRRPRHQILRHLLAGTICGAVSRTVVAPLERVKVLSMVGSEVAKNGFASTFSNVWRKEGIEGLFKGNLLNVLQIAPTKFVEFVIYDNMEEFVLRRTEQVDMSGIKHLALGTMASLAGTFISHPIDSVRTAISMEIGGAQKSVIESTRSILKNKGFLGLYRGIIPNMIRIAPYCTINFVIYDRLEQRYRKRVGRGGDLGVLPTVVFSALAGAFAQTAVYPLETVQRRLQAQVIQQSPIIYRNIIDAFKVIIREEGVNALYAGLLPNYLKLVPAAAVSLLAYEMVKEKLDFRDE